MKHNPLAYTITRRADSWANHTLVKRLILYIRSQKNTCEETTDNERRKILRTSNPGALKAAYIAHMGPVLADQLRNVPGEKFQIFIDPAVDAILQANRLGLQAELITGRLPKQSVRLFKRSFPETEGMPVSDLEASHKKNKDRSRYFAFTVSRNQRYIGFAQGFRVANGFLIEYAAVNRANRRKGILKNFISFTALMIAESGEKDRESTVEHLVFESERVGQGDSFWKRAESVVRSDMIFGPMNGVEYLVEKEGVIHPLYLQVADQEWDKNGMRLCSQTLAFSSFPVPRNEHMPKEKAFQVEKALEDVVNAYENRPGLNVPDWKRRNAREARQYTAKYLHEEGGKKSVIVSKPLNLAPSHIEMAKHFPEFAIEVIDNFGLKIDKKDADNDEGRRTIARLANARLIHDLKLMEAFYDYKGKARKLEEKLLKRVASPDYALKSTLTPALAGAREGQLVALASQLKSASSVEEKIGAAARIGMASESLEIMVAALIKVLRSDQAIQYRLGEASKDQISYAIGVPFLYTFIRKTVNLIRLIFGGNI